MAAGLRGRQLHGGYTAGAGAGVLAGPDWCNWRATPRRAQWVATAKEEVSAQITGTASHLTATAIQDPAGNSSTS